ncbi:MAG: hypothetical protein PHO76_10545 [Methylotenera sp.]|nr:hypothetical protein [Methylotenera sp.]MDD4925808.1 hypothetical protein [Methylotenera sp.]
MKYLTGFYGWIIAAFLGYNINWWLGALYAGIFILIPFVKHLRLAAKVTDVLEQHYDYSYPAKSHQSTTLHNMIKDEKCKNWNPYDFATGLMAVQVNLLATNSLDGTPRLNHDDDVSAFANNVFNNARKLAKSHPTIAEDAYAYMGEVAQKFNVVL